MSGFSNPRRNRPTPSKPVLDRRAGWLVFTPGSYRAGKVYSLDRYPGMTCGFCQQRPASVGYVKARSADPFESPSVQPNYLAAEYDQQVVVAALKMVRRFMQTPEMAQFFDSETLPGSSVSDDGALLGFARQYGITSFHFAGTSKMGPSGGPLAVVNPQLQVHGIEGLRIADASVMPMIASAVSPQVDRPQPTSPRGGFAAVRSEGHRAGRLRAPGGIQHHPIRWHRVVPALARCGRAPSSAG